MPEELFQVSAKSHYVLQRCNQTPALKGNFTHRPYQCIMAVGGKEGMKEATDVCLVAWGSAQRQVGDKSRGVPTPPSTSRD